GQQQPRFKRPANHSGCAACASPGSMKTNRHDEGPSGGAQDSVPRRSILAGVLSGNAMSYVAWRSASAKGRRASSPLMNVTVSTFDRPASFELLSNSTKKSAVDPAGPLASSV